MRAPMLAGSPASWPAAAMGSWMQAKPVMKAHKNSDSQPGACRSTCVLAGCGDGILDAGEACDQGTLEF